MHDAADPRVSSTGLPTIGQPAIELSSDLSAFSPVPADTVGVLPLPSLRFRDHLGSRWRLLHVSPESGHEAPLVCRSVL